MTVAEQVEIAYLQLHGGAPQRGDRVFDQAERKKQANCNPQSCRCRGAEEGISSILKAGQ
jgi:hypothetical protein